MSLHIWIEENSLDPQKPSAKNKVEKLIKALITERDWVLKELRGEVEHVGSTVLTTLQQIKWAIEDSNNPLWGMNGPMQGMPVDRCNVLAAEFHQINETLDAIYILFPEFKPATKPKRPKKKADPVKVEGRKKKTKKDKD